MTYRMSDSRLVIMTFAATASEVNDRPIWRDRIAFVIGPHRIHAVYNLLDLCLVAPSGA